MGKNLARLEQDRTQYDRGRFAMLAEKLFLPIARIGVLRAEDLKLLGRHSRRSRITHKRRFLADYQRAATFDATRTLVSVVIVTAPPNTEDFAVEVKGRLAELCGIDAFPHGSRGKKPVVAGVRYIAKPTIAEALFSYRRAA
jgi:hypothetical protein